MTTIAYNHRDKELAADSQGTCGYNKVSGNIVKIIRVKVGWVGFCGSVADSHELVEALNGLDVKGDLSKLEFGAIVLPDKGRAYICEVSSLGKLTKLYLTDHWCVGSGADLALGAMAAGASAKEAVKIATKYDIYSGGRIMVKKQGDKK